MAAVPAQAEDLDRIGLGALDLEGDAANPAGRLGHAVTLGDPAAVPPARPPDDPVQTLRARHAAQGLHLHPRTGISRWYGERIDMGWAISVMHPRARHAECVEGSLLCAPVNDRVSAGEIR